MPTNRLDYFLFFYSSPVFGKDQLGRLFLLDLELIKMRSQYILIFGQRGHEACRPKEQK